MKAARGAAPVRVLEADFFAAAEPGRTLPPAESPEVAFGGRSNVGKSSLLGALAGRRRLVRVSRTPGRTRGVILFRIRTDRGLVTFADLPGYGHAAVSREVQEAWGPLVEGYLSGRERLRGIVALVDARRGLEPDDRELLTYADAHALATLVVVTKSDKISRSKRKPVVESVTRAAGRRALLVSSTNAEGLDAVWHWIAAVAFDERP